MFATNSALRMSPFTNRTLESAISSLIVPRFPAYVSLSKTTTYISSSYFFNKYFKKFAPINPAAPVTKYLFIT